MQKFPAVAPSLALALLILFALPFLPDRLVDPWQLFNPRRNAQIILLIASFEFGGYFVERWAGARAGAIAKGFLGGLASSTAVFVTMANRSADEPGRDGEAVMTCLAATIATLLLFLVIIGSTSLPLLLTVGMPATITMVGIGLIATWTFRTTAQPAADAPATRTMGIEGILKLSFFVFALLAASTLAERHLGTEAVEVISFVTGLFELHATTFAGATLHRLGQLTTPEATSVLLIGATGSIASKIAISWIFGSRRFAVKMTASLLTALILSATAYATT